MLKFQHFTKNRYPQEPMDKIVYNLKKLVDNFWNALNCGFVRLLKNVGQDKNIG